MRLRIMLTILLLALPGALPGGSSEPFLFIHHSVGDGWLNAGQLAAQLTALGYEVHDATYGDAVGGPNAFGLNPLGDYTDVCHWYWWFNHAMDATLVWDCAAGESNRIVMFKSCFPNSVIYEDGVAPGDPTNDTHSTWNHKAAYLSLTNAFAARSNTLFIAVTAPPVKRGDGYDPVNAVRARAFHHWLRNDYVADYRAATGLRNLAVFDLCDMLATPATAPRNANALLQRYCTRDSHPNARGSRAATGAFLPFLRDTLAYEAGGALASNRYLVGVQATFKAATRKCTVKAYLDSATGAAGDARVWLGEALVQTFPAASWKNGKSVVKNPDGTRAWLKILAKAPPQLQLHVVLPELYFWPLRLRVELGNGAVYVVDVLP